MSQATHDARRGRTLTAKGRATRRRIVEAAAELVLAHGVARTGVEDVQRAAGVSASQLYHYFDDKEDLVRAVIAHQTDAVLEAQRPVLDRLDSFEALEEWRDLLVGLQVQRACTGGCPIGSLAAELAEDHPSARLELVAGFERWEAPIRAGLTAMRERGDLQPGADPEALALALLVALQGGLLLTQTRRSVVPLRTGLDAAIDHVRSYAAEGASAPHRSPAGAEQGH